MIPKLKIALGQMTSVNNVERNFSQIQKAIEDAAVQGARIIFFPENCLFMRIQEGAKIDGFQLGDSIFSKLSELADHHQIALHLGSVPLREAGKLSNASIFIHQGKVAPTYRKIHLFDIELHGHKPIRESDIFGHGEKPSVLEFEGWKLGQSICYDLRFAELYREYAKAQVDAILVPSAFLVPTGKAHWEILLRARAIESQAYVIAPAQAGIHRDDQGRERFTYGHSLVVDPWGQKLVEGTAEGPEVLVVELDRKLVESARTQIPMHSHRRL